MAEPRKVTLTIQPDGRTNISAAGYEGGQCLDATAAFEAMFGKVEKPREMVGACAATPDLGERVR